MNTGCALFLDSPLLVEECSVNLQSSLIFNSDGKVQRGPIIPRDNRYSGEYPGLRISLSGLNPGSITFQCV